MYSYFGNKFKAISHDFINFYDHFDSSKTHENLLIKYFKLKGRPPDVHDENDEKRFNNKTI